MMVQMFVVLLMTEARASSSSSSRFRQLQRTDIVPVASSPEFIAISKGSLTSVLVLLVLTMVLVAAQFAMGVYFYFMIYRAKPTPSAEGHKPESVTSTYAHRWTPEHQMSRTGDSTFTLGLTPVQDVPILSGQAQQRARSHQGSHQGSSYH